MGWSVDADTYNADAELSNATKYQPCKMNSNIILRYVRSWVVVFNNPSFTGLTMKIYASNESYDKGKLLHTATTTWTKTQVTAENNAIREIYFEFNDISLNKDNWYHFALSGTPSSFSSSSCIAWKMGWPDPVYRTGLSVTYPNRAQNYDLYFIGSEL